MSKKINLSVEGMSCGHCVKKVEEILSKVEAVKKVKVNLKKNEALVTAEETVNTDSLISAVTDGGFPTSLK